MKSLLLSLLIPATLCAYGCGRTGVALEKLAFEGDSLPEISHVIDMKMSGDTLFFVYECPDGYGQQILRRAIVDSADRQIVVGPEIGSLGDGYYVCDLPYPFYGMDGDMEVISRMDGEIFTIGNDNGLVKTGRVLFGESSEIPFPISVSTDDVFRLTTDSCVFVGRKPRGGEQYAFVSDMAENKVDTIRGLSADASMRQWTVNMGEMVYSAKHRRMAFAYLLHPVVEYFSIDKHDATRVCFGESTFDAATVDEADIDLNNPLHFIDLSCTDDYIYALYSGYMFDKTSDRCRIIRLDWDGNILGDYDVPSGLYKIAAYGDGVLIAWTGQDFDLIRL